MTTTSMTLLNGRHTSHPSKGKSRYYADEDDEGKSNGRVEDAVDIDALEVEEGRLVNALTLKLETLRAEKADLESALEEESESLVLRLQRQLSLLMPTQQQQASTSMSNSQYYRTRSTSFAATNVTDTITRKTCSQMNGNGAHVVGDDIESDTPPTSPYAAVVAINGGVTNTNRASRKVSFSAIHQNNSADIGGVRNQRLVDTLMNENERLKEALVDVERHYQRSTRQSEAWKSELIGLRRSAGIPVDDLLDTSPSTPNQDSTQAPSSSRHRVRGTSTSQPGMPIPGSSSQSAWFPSSLYTCGGRKTSTGTSSQLSLSFGQVSSSFPPSTPLSPLSGESNGSESGGLGTGVTTPEGSYGGMMRVPNTTPAASPWSVRHVQIDWDGFVGLPLHQLSAGSMNATVSRGDGSDGTSPSRSATSPTIHQRRRSLFRSASRDSDGVDEGGLTPLSQSPNTNSRQSSTSRGRVR